MGHPELPERASLGKSPPVPSEVAGSTLRAMARRDAAGTDARRRAALKERLWGAGVSDDLAEAWIVRWEAEAARLGLQRDADYWRLAAEWIDRERGAS